MPSVTTEKSGSRGENKNEGIVAGKSKGGSTAAAGNKSGRSTVVSEYKGGSISAAGNKSGRSTVVSEYKGESTATSDVKGGSIVTALYKSFSTRGSENKSESAAEATIRSFCASGYDSKSGSTVGAKNEFTVTTSIPMKTKIIEKVEYQTRDITVTLPVVTPGAQSSVYSRSSGAGRERVVTVPAKEIKKITTIQEISPTRVQTLVIKKLDPIVSKKYLVDKVVTEVKTPLQKNLKTTTTVKRTTQVTIETTTIIGPGKNEDTTGQEK